MSAPALLGEAARAAAVGCLFLLIFVGAEAWKRRCGPPVEWTRKAVHVGGGLVVATLPWVFTSHWTVLVLGVLFGGILWGTRHLGLLGSVHGVERRSEGGLYYPLAVYLLFLVGAERPALYLISVLVLVVSDSAAALMGSEFGRRFYSVESDRRSVEGSLAFLVATFLCAYLPLRLLIGLETAASLLIALQLALLVTLFEAISLRGNDNLVVPLATFYLLVKMTPRPAEWIAEQLLAQVGITAVVAVVSWRWRCASASGTMGLSLLFYGAYALGGAEWIVAPGLALGALVALHRCASLTPANRTPGYQVATLFYVCVVAAALFVANNALETLLPEGVRPSVADPLYVPFVGAVAAQTGVVILVLLGGGRGTRSVVAAAAACAVALGGLAVGGGGISAWGAGVNSAVVLGSMGLYESMPRTRTNASGLWRVRLQAASVAAATLVLLPLHLWRIGAL
ncbi:MAG: hypothetical protein M3409_12175 [Gemmatimonadota bacterium]|nr:hypothetical protein [Gemmatimonadota bacterium]